MTVTQLSVFTQSRPGHLAKILDVFEKGHINVRGFSVSDTGDYGIARFIVDKPDEAKVKLEEIGSAFTSTQVICLKLADTPGELARVMGVLAACDINVKYSYSMISTYIIISTEDVDKVRGLLEEEPVSVISQDEITRL